MEIIYKKIVDTFNANEAVFTDLGLPPIRQIDINYGQPDNPEGFEIFFPAMFITWNITEQSINEASELMLEFHLLQDPGNGTENFSNNKDAGLEYISMIKTVKYILNQLRATNTTGLQFAGENANITPYFRYHIIYFKCFIDKVEDSLTKGSVDKVELEDYTKDFKTKNKVDIPPTPDIDIMNT